MNENNNNENIKPMLANCKKIEILAPLGWLALGWKDCLYRIFIDNAAARLFNLVNLRKIFF